MKRPWPTVFLSALLLLLALSGCAAQEPAAISSREYTISRAQVHSFLPIGSAPYVEEHGNGYISMTTTALPPEAGTMLHDGREATGRLLLSVWWGYVVQYADGTKAVEQEEYLPCTLLAAQDTAFHVENSARTEIFSFDSYEAFVAFFQQYPRLFF